MFKEMKSRRLALLVAIALGGGGFLSSAQSVSAADVTGNNVEIDSAHEPLNNAKDDQNTPFGTAAGFIHEGSNSGNVTNNTLTFKDHLYGREVFGGFTFGKGNVTGNKVFINPATATPPGSIVNAAYGGVTDGGGSVEDNHVTFNGTRANGDIIGGMTTRKSYAKDGRGNGAAKKNTATLEGGTVDTVYGGYTGEGSDGDVVGNTALVKGGVVTTDVYGGYAAQGGAAKDNIAKITNGTVNGTIYGGYAAEKDVTGNRVTVSGGSVGSSVYGGKAGVGNATNNTVTIAGTGTVGQHVYGGGSTGGDAINNTVNLGDGTSNAVGTITGTIFGGRTSSAKDQTTGNTLNVNANAQAGNIENFSTINFDFSHVDTSRTLLKLVNTYNNKTKLQSLDQLHVKNAKVGGGTLIENAHGFELGNSTDVGRTEGQTETIIKKDMGAKKIIYRTYQFKNATEKDTDGLTTWGGRSLLGNTTTKNEITLTGHHGGQDVYGGWTSGTGSTATGENAKNHSIDNKITFNGAASDTVGNMFGGLTVSTGGNATGNRAVLKEGKVTGSLTGGSVGGNGGSATGNFVDIEGGEVVGTTYGGSVGSTGKAEKNIVTVTGGTVKGDIYGGKSTSGNATGNEVTIKGGSATNSDVYGGESASGDATGNTVTVTKGSVRNIDGGRTGSGNATGNTVNIGDGKSDYTGSISGKINGGSSSGGGRDYTTGNTLNLYDNATAANINNFAEINFRFNQYVDTTATFLTLNDGGGTTIRSLSDINVHGAHAMKGTLIRNAHGVTVSDNKHRLVKTMSDTNKEFVLAKGTNEITYEGYSFAHQTTPTTAQNGADTDTWGGRSVGGNSTHDNEITVNSDSHTNVYGGWTSGEGTTAADKNNSYKNKVTVKGSATVSGKVYGGFTDVAGGTATGNTVTVEKDLNADLVGGKAAAEASDNTVNVTNATVKSVTGGEGTTTNNNTVNLNGAAVNGAVKGGTQATGKDNTLNVKGENSAQSVEGFQKMNFNTNGVAADGTMLNVTGSTKTKVNWNTLKVDGNGRNISLLKNNHGIDFGSTYTDGDVKSGLSADKKSETNVSVTADKKEIKYTGYQFTGVTTASVDGTKAYGGVSKAGNATHNNRITVNGSYTEVYGGHTTGTSDTAVEKKNSHDNTVTITGGTLGKVYGGYTDVDGGTTENNTVNLGDGTNPLAPSTTIAEIHGGNKSAKGNTLNVNTAATVGKIENFSTVAFKNAASKLTLTQAGANFDLDSIKADFAATESEVELVENANGLTLRGGKTFRTELSKDGTKETNIEARDDKKIVRYGYTVAGATAATTLGTEMWGGRSAAGNTTTGNRISVNDGSGTMTVYGGYTSGKGGTAADKNDSHTNTVTVTGGNMTVYGGWTNVAAGKAVSNTVNVTADAQGTLVGGYSANGEASNNVVDVRNAVFTGNITGGQGTAANYNVIRLRNASVRGTITGGIAPNVKDNTLEVSYGTGASSSVGDITNVQRLHFDMENAPVSNANPLLKLTNVSGGGDKNLTGMKFAVARSGATKKLEKGDTFTLMENTTAPGKKITVGSGVTAEGRDGVSRNYTFDISTDATGKLIATVTKAGMGEQSKSIVETRAGASAFLNDGGDYLVGSGMEAAKKEARAAAQAGNGAYGLWAGMGGGALRHKTGSYVDMKGWNLGLGWARENAVQAGTLTFGPFVEYGRGSYDSYLDDGTHGSGKTSFFGAGMMAKLETGSHWIDGSLRVGRTKSDYTGLATYDTTSTYYGVQVGVGKDFHVNETDTVGAYVRYAYSHTAGTSAHLSSGETYDFDAVNSHRLRIGTRYTHGMADFAQFYAGLAWEYEFDGDARATSQGDSAPSPSLKGSSALLELGYRFAPQGSRMSYDLNLTGWQGKRQGITGGASVKWAF
ncbi:autotransporter outer membrane beta-barrel domain-containing protein [Selenomonas dianae]|uniref:Autotransporter domain-containing protein n=1 Tax=Selenomonas dianae TaxID=135079 RepID=A0ABN0TBK6_9FIRM|nr:autotransporter outer membrane beta-barrel domain-containing protein [Selenomonas dianae]WLD82700.1 autotransporter outer membrane beta-barrel domain-containing protein [Selenomonas dianae]